jgi:WD40 repeat protein
LIFSCGYWDHSLRSNSIDTGKLVQAVYHHSDVVTSIAIGKDFNKYWLVSGSRDCTVHVWEIHLDRQDPLGLNPLHIFYGHDDAITTVAINAELDMVISGSIDGTIIMHNLREGLYVRSIVVGNSFKQPSVKPILETRSASTSNADISFISTPSPPSPQVPQHLKKVTWVGICKEGYIVVYVSEDDMLYSYTINGHLLVSRHIHERLNVFKISEDGLVLLTGGSSCLVVFWWIRTLELANTDARQGLQYIVDGSVKAKDKDVTLKTFSSPIRSIYMTKNERHLIVGLESGEMRILAQDSSYLRKRLQVKLKEIGIL